MPIRRRDSQLVNAEFAWRATTIDVNDGTAVATGIQIQHATYRGQDCSSEFRATLVVARRDGRWRIVNVQLAESPGLTMA